MQPGLPPPPPPPPVKPQPKTKKNKKALFLRKIFSPIFLLKKTNF